MTLSHGMLHKPWVRGSIGQLTIKQCKYHHYFKLTNGIRYINYSQTLDFIFVK